MQESHFIVLRERLRQRLSRVDAIPVSQFQNALRLFFAYVDSMPIVVAVRDEMLAKAGRSRIVEMARHVFQGEPIVGDSEQR
jgi:hypothetical protein